MTLGQLMDKIPHAYKEDDGVIINNSTFYASQSRNGFVRFANPTDISNNSTDTVVSPA